MKKETIELYIASGKHRVEIEISREEFLLLPEYALFNQYFYAAIEQLRELVKRNSEPQDAYRVPPAAANVKCARCAVRAEFIINRQALCDAHYRKALLCKATS